MNQSKPIKPTMSMLLTDFYKVCHPFQHINGITSVFSNMTPRKSRIAGVSKVVVAGLQRAIIKWLINDFNDNFFNKPKEKVINEYKRVCQYTVGSLKSYAHIEALHDLGYLPVRIRAIAEGEVIPIRVPWFTITNTHKDFAWVVNYLETLLSAESWQFMTSATIAHEYRKLLDEYAVKSGLAPEFVQWQGHDFSFRGMSSVESATISGMGHLLSFTGTDTIPAITEHENYYDTDIAKELVGGSVNASEHATMCENISFFMEDESYSFYENEFLKRAQEYNVVIPYRPDTKRFMQLVAEYATFKRMITEVHPEHIVSLVSDTYNLWDVCTIIVKLLKPEIMARKGPDYMGGNGKLVIRPDSGDPCNIICGDLTAPVGSPAYKGVIELLWEVFGGTQTNKGFNLLDPHIGAIYGDSITLDRAREISERLMEKGFAPQLVYGIGSYTYQYVTRDTFGTAMKATHVVVNNRSLPLYKDPITDDGTKKSARGLLRVDIVDGEYTLKDNCTAEEETGGEFKVVFENSQLIVQHKLSEVRARLASHR